MKRERKHIDLNLIKFFSMFETILKNDLLLFIENNS